MYIWNKVLVGLIFVATIPFILFAAQALKTHAYWRKAYNAHEERIAALSKENEELTKGTATEPGVRRLKLELHKMMLDRGRIWFHCQKGPIQNGAMQVTTTENPSGLTPKSLVHVFGEKSIQQGGGYLGEFRVATVNGNTLALVPATDDFSAQRLTRINNYQGTLALFDFLPHDDHEAFAGLTDEQIKAYFGNGVRPETLREYLKDGKKAEADDPQNVEIEGVVVRRRRDENGNYLRQLNDYEVLFQSHRVQASLLKALTEGAKRDKDSVSNALADAKIQVQFREKEKAELEVKKEKLTQERNIVADHQKQLEEQLAAIEKQIKDTLASNVKIAAELAQTQEEAARMIEKNVKRIAKGD